MNENEIQLLRTLEQAANQYAALDTQSSAELPEFSHHLHALQNIILARAGLRALRNAGKDLR